MKQEWTGPHDDSAPVGNGVTVLQNVFTGSKREIQRRPGWTSFDTWNVTAVSQLENSILCGSNGTRVYKYDLVTKTSTDIGAYGVPTAWANMMGATYVVGGGTPSVITTSTVRAMGLTAPSTPTVTSTSTTGTPTLGIHLIRTRKHVYDANFNRYSDPSEFVTVRFEKAEFAITVSATGANLQNLRCTKVGSGYKPGATYNLVFTGNGASQGAGTATMSNTGLNDGVASVNLTNTGAGNTYCTVTIVDPDSKTSVAGSDDVEMTLANGTLYYATPQASTTEYNIQDEEIIGWTNPYFYAGPDGYGHEPPPTDCDLICSHRNRMFMWNGKLLYWSRAGFPESWKPAEWARKVTNYGSDDATGMFSVYDDLYLCSLRGMKRFVYVSDPANGMIVDLPTALGVWNQKCIVYAEGRIFGFGPNGVWEVKAIKPELIGHVLDLQWRPICDNAQTKDKAFGYYDQENRRICWYFVKTGDTTCKVGQCIDIETGIFSMITTEQELNGAVQTQYNSTTGVFATSSTYLFQLSNDKTDGAYAIDTKIVGDWNPGSEYVDRRRFDYFRFETVPVSNQAVYKVRYYLDGSLTPYNFQTLYSTTSTPPDGVTFNAAIPTELTVQTVRGFAAVPAPTEWDRYIRFEVECTDTTGEMRLLDADFQWSRDKTGSQA